MKEESEAPAAGSACEVCGRERWRIGDGPQPERCWRGTRSDDGDCHRLGFERVSRESEDRVREVEAENLRLKDDLAEMKADLEYVFGLLSNHVPRTRPGKPTASTRCPICGAWDVHQHTYAEEYAWRQKERAAGLEASKASAPSGAPKSVSERGGGASLKGKWG